MKLLCLGTVAMDILMEVDQLPKEDGFGLIKKTTYLPGGSGTNVAVQASKLGMTTAYIAKIGDDDLGKDILKSLNEENIICDGMIVKPKGTSLHTFIVVDNEGKKFILLNFGDAFSDLTASEVSIKQIEACDVFFTDLFPKEPSLFALKKAKELGKKTVFNMQTGLATLQAFGFEKKDVLECLAWVDVFAPSREGLCDLFGVEDPRDALEEIRAYAKGIIVSTQGEKGVLCVDEKNGVIEIPACKVDAKDTTGAGDAFLGAFINSFYHENHSLTQALKRANASAAYTCENLGARSGPTREELEQFLNKGKGEGNEI